MDLFESGAVDRQGRQSIKAAPVLRRGETCWRIARADRFALIVDAADYFAAARSAMLKAEHSILLVGWDFDLRIDLMPDGREGGYPTRLGDFLKAIVQRKPWLRIFILKWDMAVLYTLGNQMLPIFALDLASVERIQMRFDSTHPWMAAHHQKIVVIDDAVAFCGGIDMTTDRWDTRRHLPGDERRRRPDGSLHGPWHDATTVVDGAAAKLLGKLVRERWRFATGRSPKVAEGATDLWPDAIRPQLRDVDVAVARTMPAYEGRGRPVGPLRPLPRRAVSDAEALLARSHLADPERPKNLEGRLEHIAKRLVLRVPPSAWLVLSAAGLAAFAAALLHRRRRRRRHEVAGCR